MTSLLLHPPPRQQAFLSSQSAKSPRPLVAPRSPLRPSHASAAGRTSQTSSTTSPSSSRASTETLLHLQDKARRHARYKIVQQKRSISSLDGRDSLYLRQERPPSVRSTAQCTRAPVTNSAPDDIRILEATIESDSDTEETAEDPITRKLQAYTASQRRLHSSSAHNSRPHSSSSIDRSNTTQDEEDIMTNFVPMLQEYLSCTFSCHVFTNQVHDVHPFYSESTINT